MKTAVATAEAPDDDGSEFFELFWFKDVERPAAAFRRGRPITVRMVGTGDEARRIIDFMSGLGYGTGGHMERVGERTYRVTPP